MGERVKVEAKKPEVKRENVNSQMRGSKNSRSTDTPVERILYLQRTAGNQAVSRLMRSGALQAKLRIGQPGDLYEQEADRVADAVMRMPEPGVQRQPEEEEEEEEALQAKEVSGRTPKVASNLETRIGSLKGSGQPLSKETRNFFEPRFGHDFSGVKIHTDSNANQLARSINAKAFTIGNDIAFEGGKYSPETSKGKRLMGHELAHVVQQGGDIFRSENHTEHDSQISDTFSSGIFQRASNLIQRDVIIDQPLGPHLYNEIDSGQTSEPTTGIVITYWYRIYEVSPGVYIDRLYDDLETLYGLGSFWALTPSVTAYLPTDITSRGDRFFALYPNSQSRDPIDLTKLHALKLGRASPREVAQPRITACFTERGDDAWKELSPIARVYINEWGNWSLRGLEQFLGDILIEEDRSVLNALNVFGSLVWALTAFIPVVGPITRAVAGIISVVSALSASFASIKPGVDLNTERKKEIRKVQDYAVSLFMDKLDQREHLLPILITVLVKVQERGMSAPERDALLWNHMFDIPYATAGGRRNGILQRAYGALTRSWGEQIQ